MVSRFLIWIYLWIARHWLSIEIKENKKPKTFIQLEVIRDKLIETPQSVKLDTTIDTQLLKGFNTRLTNVGQIFTGLSLFIKAFGEQINDASYSKPIDNRRIQLGNVVEKYICFSHFQFDGENDITINESLSYIQQEINTLLVFYDLILSHQDIEPEYIPYIDRILSVFLDEVLNYVNAVQVIGVNSDAL